MAWNRAELGTLFLKAGRLADAEREFAHAAAAFPGHRHAVVGLARVAEARGRHADALARVESLIAKSPSPELFAYSSDLMKQLGRFEEAKRRGELAEAAWRSDAPDPARLAVFLADSGDPIRMAEAVEVAERGSRDRDDIFTNDALAWAYFKVGRLEDAVEASHRALRTGSNDRVLRAHARAISDAAALRASR